MERRKFIRNSLALLTPTIIGGNPIHVLQDHPMLDTALLATANNENVLVIIQLSGGNDGLNIVRSIVPGLVPMTFGFGQAPLGMKRLYEVASLFGKKMSYRLLNKFTHPFA